MCFCLKDGWNVIIHYWPSKNLTTFTNPCFRILPLFPIMTCLIQFDSCKEYSPLEWSLHVPKIIHKIKFQMSTDKYLHPKTRQLGRPKLGFDAKSGFQTWENSFTHLVGFSEARKSFISSPKFTRVLPNLGPLLSLWVKKILASFFSSCLWTKFLSL